MRGRKDPITHLASNTTRDEKRFGVSCLWYLSDAVCFEFVNVLKLAAGGKLVD